jgi:hypothetical protein
MSNELIDQLKVFHDPFAGTTNTPKIPDGATPSSIGLSNQAVFELDCRETTHMLLYPGMTSCLTYLDGVAGFGGRTIHNTGFEGGNQLLFNDGTGASGAFRTRENYALWRVVSCGLQMKLLNTSEENDGWWEAIRISEPVDTSHWVLSTTDDVGDPTNYGCVSPGVNMIGELSGRTSLSSDASYATGLMRDLNRVQFDLHGIQNSHPFIKQQEYIGFSEDTFAAFNLSHLTQTINNGSDDGMNFINLLTDQTYDMIYIRLHSRAYTGTSPFLGSQVHCNVVSNQEVFFEQNQTENRYHSRNEMVSADVMALHALGRKSLVSAATLI